MRAPSICAREFAVGVGGLSLSLARIITVDVVGERRKLWKDQKMSRWGKQDFTRREFC
jgi:hypothetical protein